MTDGKAWWGTTAIPLGEERRWLIGPLRLRIARLSGEWRIRHHTGSDPLEGTVRVAEAQDLSDEIHEDDTALRFASSGDDFEISLNAALADRSIVSHPAEAFYVLPGDETRLFVSTPVWLRIATGPERDLFELPILRPSDTWVGATTGGGRAAYSSRTFCRLRLEDLPYRPHRAVTVVRVRNRTNEPLPLERISVAVPHLSIFASNAGRLWTESITLTREADDPEVEIEIADQPPSEADGNRKLASPREPIVGNRLRSAFDALF